MKPHKLSTGLLLLVLLPVFSGQTQQVSSTVARSVALNFMNRMYSGQSHSIKTFSREGLYPMQAVTSDAATINVVTFNQGGWVILSNDESAPPILAFCGDGDFSLDTNDMPGGLIELLQDYRDAVTDIRRAYAAKGTASDFSENQSAWSKLKNSQTKGYPVTIYVDNLLKNAKGEEVKWGQARACDAERAYNKYMPKGYDLIGDCVYGRKHAGCGTVAMAQIMWYWKFPPQYEWDEMPYTIYCNTPMHQVNYIARLFRDCGEANNMRYASCAGSFTTTEDLAAGMRTVQYTHATKLRKGVMGKKKWQGIIRSNLDVGRPMVYRGDKCDVCLQEMHFWDISGYGSDDLFYCNWGWRGSYDGWFRLDSLRPGNSNFRVNNMIINDIFPNWNVQSDGTFENITRSKDEDLRAFNRNITLKNVTLTDNAQAKLCFTETLTIEGPLTIGPNTSFILQSCAKEAAAAQAMQTAAYHDGDDEMDALSEEYEEPMAGLMEVAQPETDEAFSSSEPSNTWGLWPNPNQGTFEIWVAAPDLIRQSKTLSVYNANGNLVYETDFEGERCSVNGVQGKGLHIVVLKTPGQVYAQKILIR